MKKVIVVGMILLLLIATMTTLAGAYSFGVTASPGQEGNDSITDEEPLNDCRTDIDARNAGGSFEVYVDITSDVDIVQHSETSAVHSYWIDENVQISGGNNSSGYKDNGSASGSAQIYVVWPW